MVGIRHPKLCALSLGVCMLDATVGEELLCLVLLNLPLNGSHTATDRFQPNKQKEIDYA